MSSLVNFPRSPFLDETGRPSREWVQWLLNPQVITLTVGGSGSGALSVTSGGTGLATVPGANQILIGNGAGYSLASFTSLLPAYSGDATTTVGGTVITFNAVNTNIGIFGDASHSVSVTVNSKGLVTAIASQQINTSILGSVTNDLAAAGNLGEYVTSSVSAVPLATGVNNNITSISLTAGDWDVDGSSGVVAAAGTLITAAQGGSSSVSATFGSFGSYWQDNTSFSAAATIVRAMPTTRFSLAVTTTIYLVQSATFTVSTATASGFLRARRVR